MTIYDDGVEIERVVLSNYPTKEAMHALMIEKGFIRKRPKEIEAMKKRLRAQADAVEREKRISRAKRKKQNKERKRQNEDSPRVEL
mmetsp:Transcript_24088/g.37151  ORF Transcript_24088/g.37151 Transcript_24088/m.37151 type:complete len:86 (+) Transcript_24088:241-498(+)